MQNLQNKIYNLIRRSEGFFKADMLYIVKSNFWQMSGQVTTSLLSLGLAVLFANLLPKETYGLYKYILSLAGVLNIFTLSGMNQAVVQAVANGKDYAFKTSVKYQIKWNSMQLIAAWAVGGYYFYKDNPQMGIAFLVLGIFAPLTAALNTYGAYLEGKKIFKLNNVFSVISTIIYVSSMVVAILFSGEALWLVVAYSLATFTSTLLCYLVTLKLFNPPTAPAEDVLKYGRELTFISFVGPLVAQIDKIILSHFWGAAQLAVYSLATAVPERAIPLIKDWVGIALPKFSTKTARELDEVFYLRILQGMAIGAICFVGYLLVAPYLFKYLIPKYLEGVFYSQLLAVSFIFAMPNRYIGLLLTSQKLSRLSFISNSIQNVIRIILYIVLGIWGGILGLVSTHVLMSAVGMVINTIAWKRYGRSKI